MQSDALNHHEERRSLRNHEWNRPLASIQHSAPVWEKVDAVDGNVTEVCFVVVNTLFF